MKALVLSGGGSLGSYQCGVLKYLLGEQKKQYDILAGVSVGAINTAFLAQFKAGQEQEAIRKLEELWLNIDNSKVKSFHFPPYISALWNRGIYSTKPLRKTIEENLDPKLVATSGKLLLLGAVSLTTGKYELWNEQDSDLIDGIMASSAYPGFFDNISARNEEWVDGGARNITPLSDAIKAGADEIDVIVVQHSGTGNKNGKFKTINTLIRSLTIMMDEVFVNDLKVCVLKNSINGYKKIDLKVYIPSKGLHGDSLDFVPINIKRNMELGYEDAKNNKEENYVG